MATAHGSWFARADRTGVPLLLARLIVGGVFVYMGCMKVASPVEFLKQIHLFNMLPAEPGYYLNATAIVLPWLEIICGAALILGVFVRGAALNLLIMLSVFTPAIFLRAWTIRATEGTPFFEIAFDCGCGSGPVTIWTKLLENLGLWLAALVAILSQSRRFCLSALWSRGKQAMANCVSCGAPLRSTVDDLCPECPPSVRDTSVAASSM